MYDQLFSDWLWSTHVIVGVGQNKLVLELGAEEVLVLLGAVGDVFRVPDVGPAEDVQAGEEAIVVLVVVVDLLPSQGLVGQQSTLGLPARVVVQGLQDDAVDVDVVGGKLTVELQTGELEFNSGEWEHIR